MGGHKKRRPVGAAVFVCRKEELPQKARLTLSPPVNQGPVLPL